MGSAVAPEKKGQANDIPATLVVVYYSMARESHKM